MSSPFDEARYKTLLNGLDINIVKLSEVGLRNENFRIDSDYFRKRYIEIESIIVKNKSRRMSEFNPDILHPKEIKREYEDEGGVLFFRTQNLRPLRVDLSSQVYISLEDAKTLQNNAIRKNDVLITRTGANFGDTLVVVDNLEAIASSHVFILRNKAVNQAYLAVFLNTKYGREQINRGMYGGVQPEIAPYYLRNILVPDVSDDFQKQIEKTVKAAHAKLEQSKSLYAQAEATLLDELGLKNWKPPKESAAVKSFSESFGKSGRLDAEYYQPASDVIIAKLKKFEHARVGGVVQMMNGYAWKSGFFKERGDEGFDEGEPFIRIRDCKPGSLDIAELDRIEYEYASGEDVEKARAGDIVVGMDGLKWFYASLITKPCYINQRVSWLRLLENSKLTAEYLTLFLDSIAGQTQLLREMTIADTVGHLSNNGIASVFVPILPNGVIKKITKQFSDSFITKQESKRLLELAKQAVETAIEKGEKAGSKMVQ